MRGQLLVGDCRQRLRELGAGSAHCCVTSPPYWGLRDYGAPGQVGLERSPGEYVEELVGIFREVRRVLREDGALWLNLGDSYLGAGDSNHDKGTARGARREEGAKSWHNRARGLADGNLAGIPWRVALALQADGWVLRSDAVWEKANPLPESVQGWRWEGCRQKVGSLRGVGRQGYAAAGRHRDKAHGNLEDQPSAQWEDCAGCPRCLGSGGQVLRKGSWRPTRAHEYVFLLTRGAGYYGSGEWVREGAAAGGGRNLRDVWSMAAQPSALRHFAMMPPALAEKCVLASCPEACCAGCGAPHAPVVGRGRVAPEAGGRLRGMRPTCGCGAGAEPGVVLDPFLGAGTVAGVAEGLGRRWVGIELSADYAGLVPARVAEVGAYFARRRGAARARRRGAAQGELF